MKNWDAILMIVVVLSGMGGCIALCIQDDNKEQAAAANVAAHTKTTVETINTPIYSLALNSEVVGHIEGGMNGGFFLGIGDVSGSMNGSITQNSVYYFYKDSGNGGIILSKVNADSVALIKTDSTPHLETVSSIVRVFGHESQRDIVSQRLFVPINYRLLGEFKK